MASSDTVDKSKTHQNSRLVGVQEVILPNQFFLFKCIIIFQIVGHTMQRDRSYSQTWDQPMYPALEAQILNHWTTREVPPSPFFEHKN